MGQFHQNSSFSALSIAAKTAASSSHPDGSKQKGLYQLISVCAH
jgi:hypothetical protein